MRCIDIVICSNGRPVCFAIHWKSPRYFHNNSHVCPKDILCLTSFVLVFFCRYSRAHSFVVSGCFCRWPLFWVQTRCHFVLRSGLCPAYPCYRSLHSRLEWFQWLRLCLVSACLEPLPCTWAHVLVPLTPMSVIYQWLTWHDIFRYSHRRHLRTFGAEWCRFHYFWAWALTINQYWWIRTWLDSHLSSYPNIAKSMWSMVVSLASSLMTVEELPWRLDVLRVRCCYWMWVPRYGSLLGREDTPYVSILKYSFK